MRLDFAKEQKGNPNLERSEFYKRFNELYVQWKRSEGWHQTVNAMSKFVSPARQVCIDNEQEPYAFELIFHLDDCIKANADISVAKEMAIVPIEFTITRLLESQTKLKRIGTLL